MSSGERVWAEFLWKSRSNQEKGFQNDKGKGETNMITLEHALHEQGFRYIALTKQAEGRWQGRCLPQR